MKIIKFAVYIALFILVERFCHRQTEGFRMQKIASDLSYREEWATPPPPEEVKALLAQPYRYLGSGGQCYAFASEDGTAVIKFFKHHHMKPLPFSIEKKKRQERLETIFGSFKIAYDRLKEETGMLYLQLNRREDFQKPLILIDPIGIHHSVDPNQMTFALQKRATLAFPTLQALIDSGKTEEAKTHLISLIDLIIKRTQAHVADFDPIIKRNMGFIDGKAVEIDLGSFLNDDNLSNPIAQRRVLFFETLKMRSWLKKRAPDLLSFFDLQLDERFAILSRQEV